MPALDEEASVGAAVTATRQALQDELQLVIVVDNGCTDGTASAARQAGAMTVPQRFGNWLAPLLVRMIWGVRCTDLGPLRAIRRDSLASLAMRDRDSGWTIEMQVRAAKQNLRIAEIPTGYRRRLGVSKISGTVDGVLKAGSKILYVIGREALAISMVGTGKIHRRRKNWRHAETSCATQRTPLGFDPLQGRHAS